MVVQTQMLIILVNLQIQTMDLVGIMGVWILMQIIMILMLHLNRLVIVLYSGCLDGVACNYNPEANQDNGSCEYAQQGYDCEGKYKYSLG